VKKPILLFRKVKNEWLLWLLLLLFLFCCVRLFWLENETAQTMTEETSYVPQSFIDTLRKLLEG
jgi:hypothetical protein